MGYVSVLVSPGTETSRVLHRWGAGSTLETRRRLNSCAPECTAQLSHGLWSLSIFDKSHLRSGGSGRSPPTARGGRQELQRSLKKVEVTEERTYFCWCGLLELAGPRLNCAPAATPRRPSAAPTRMRGTAAPRNTAATKATRQEGSGLLRFAAQTGGVGFSFPPRIEIKGSRLM